MDTGHIIRRLLVHLIFFEEGVVRKRIKRHANLQGLLLSCQTDYLAHKALQEPLLSRYRAIISSQDRREILLHTADWRSLTILHHRKPVIRSVSCPKLLQNSRRT